MERKISFSVPQDASDRESVLARLTELVELINMEKDEQELEPSFFKGNLSDYPTWFTESFENREHRAILEKICGYEKGDLDEWDMESWYDDFFEIPSHTFSIQQTKDGAGSHTLSFTVDQKDYVEGNVHLWILVSAGTGFAAG